MFKIFRMRCASSLDNGSGESQAHAGRSYEDLKVRKNCMPRNYFDKKFDYFPKSEYTN